MSQIITPTRYRASFERGEPVDYCTRPEADRAIEDADGIVELCRHRLNPQAASPGLSRTVLRIGSWCARQVRSTARHSVLC